MFQKVLLLCLLIYSATGDTSCPTIKGENGTLIPKEVCQISWQKHVDVAIRKEFSHYISQYNYNKTHICCPPEDNWETVIENFHTFANEITTRIDKEAEVTDCKHTVIPPDSTTACCGLTNSLKVLYFSRFGRVYDSGFPWLVLLESSDGSQLCGGSLISSKFVLTAAHCLTSDRGKPTKVHLGAYERLNPNKTEDTATIAVESYYIHPAFDKNDPHHDIALIKLAKFAPYNFQISPICLPSLDVVTKGAPFPSNFAVAGWGRTETGEFSNHKLFVATPMLDREECKKTLATGLSPNQICVGCVTGEGDGGGPLEMLEEESQGYAVAGIVSYETKICTDRSAPSVYTNVYMYKDWIYNVTSTYGF